MFRLLREVRVPHSKLDRGFSSRPLEAYLCGASTVERERFDSESFSAPQVIDTIDGLSHTLRAVRRSKRVAFDSEFIVGATYSPSLEVVQLATTDGSSHEIRVVDCRSLEQLQKGSVSELLSQVIERPLVLHAVRKRFETHGSRSILPVVHCRGFNFKVLF